jgi:hypothetical protein
MQAPSGSQPVTGSPSSRVRELGLVLPTPPTPLGAYVESADTGNLLFLSGILPGCLNFETVKTTYFHGSKTGCLIIRRGKYHG